LQQPLRVAGTWLARRFVAAYRRRARDAAVELRADELAWFTRLHASRILLDTLRTADERHPYAILRRPARDLVRAE
jgi:hypothetical protein